MRTVVGLYDDFTEAQGVVRDLQQAGFDREKINVIARDAKGEYTQHLEKTDAEARAENLSDETATGAGVGAALGGLGGLLAGLAAIAIPGIGPVIAAGPIMAALAGAGVGALAGGMIGALVESGVPEENARQFAEGVRRGGSLITLHADDEHVDQAVEIFNRHHPVNLKTRTESWRTSGAEDFNDKSQPWSPDEVAAEEKRIRSMQIPVTSGKEVDLTGQQDLGESGSVYTYPYGTGGQQFGEKRTDQSTGQSGFSPDSTRQYGSTGSGMPGDTSTSRQAGMETNRTDQTRYQDFQQYEPVCRVHFESSYQGMGRSYDDFRPAYRYGYELANDPRYQGRPWSEIETDARRDWETRSQAGALQSTWEDMKDAVRKGWESVTS